MKADLLSVHLRSSAAKNTFWRYKFERREGAMERCGSGVKSSPGLMN
jgi:hypothetical protein